jgi:Fe-S cluster assembly protein SufD
MNSMLSKNFINDKFRLPGTDTLIILNGQYQPELSSLTSDINFNGETLIIPQKTKIKAPLHFLFFSTKDHDNDFEVIMEDNSTVTLIEEYVSLLEKPYICNANFKITTKPNSSITHYKLQTANPLIATYKSIINIDQHANSKITTNFISKGAKATKETLNVTFAGENASFELTGINLLNNKQNMSNQICVKHLKPKCLSNVFIKSVVDDQAINSFDCRIIAEKNAAKTETHVTNKNLLLSLEAQAITSPELEIYVDDVICTHGATVGALDQDALFYLQTRGIIKTTATKILISAFVHEIIDRFTKFNRLKSAAGLTYGQ